MGLLAGLNGCSPVHVQVYRFTPLFLQDMLFALVYVELCYSSRAGNAFAKEGAQRGGLVGKGRCACCGADYHTLWGTCQEPGRSIPSPTSVDDHSLWIHACTSWRVAATVSYRGSE